ncbi:MAG: 16S rRNA (guanine(527)-N(7))-methyltransferase RsmG [Pseudomonadota bacterium]
MTEQEARTQLLASGVSRETLDRLNALAGLIAKWTKRINLISPTSVERIWSRHILDSAQIGRHGPLTVATWADLGSGGGLPGLVVAALRSGVDTSLETTLIESDQRKCAFLSTASREIGVNARILAQRVETIVDVSFDVVSARALAPMDRLLCLAQPLTAEGGRMLFLKGANAQAELTAANETWNMEVVRHQSVTDPAATILDVRKAVRRHEHLG